MSEVKEPKSKAPRVTMAFHRWMLKEKWTWHSNGYFYKDEGQWPAQETASEDELLIMFFGM